MALNRRAFMIFMREEIARAKRYGHSLSLLLVDIDHFKSINGSHGHGVGDEALKNLVVLIRNQMRTVDAVARMGFSEVNHVPIVSCRYQGHCL
ncbi:MAG: GGDEF domain-containing protein [Magnetococcales bacterium]|nr:GGDEF domain-containing protein [Magnetococcales bacterium]